MLIESSNAARLHCVLTKNGKIPICARKPRGGQFHGVSDVDSTKLSIVNWSQNEVVCRTVTKVVCC